MILKVPAVVMGKGCIKDHFCHSLRAFAERRFCYWSKGKFSEFRGLAAKHKCLVQKCPGLRQTLLVYR